LWILWTLYHFKFTFMYLINIIKGICISKMYLSKRNFNFSILLENSSFRSELFLTICGLNFVFGLFRLRENILFLLASFWLLVDWKISLLWLDLVWCYSRRGWSSFLRWWSSQEGIVWGTASARAIREIVLRATVMIFSEPLITSFTIVSNILK